MLLITRRPDESVIINGDIEMTVVEVRGNRVKLGFQYPDGNSVYRKELYLRIQEENRAAAHSRGDHIGDIINRIRKPKNDRTNNDSD